MEKKLNDYNTWKKKTKKNACKSEKKIRKKNDDLMLFSLCLKKTINIYAK